jgi:hypothetical protein
MEARRAASRPWAWIGLGRAEIGSQMRRLDLSSGSSARDRTLRAATLEAIGDRSEVGACGGGEDRPEPTGLGPTRARTTASVGTPTLEGFTADDTDALKGGLDHLMKLGRLPDRTRP